MNESYHWNLNPYYTHQPMLRYFANQITNGKILELGSGEGSTNILHDICFENKNTLYTLDNNTQWLSKFKNLKSDSHKIINVHEHGNEHHWINTLNENKF